MVHRLGVFSYNRELMHQELLLSYVIANRTHAADAEAKALM